MKMQLIQAPNMKIAMMRIQEELGPDAMIYQTRKSLSGIEVVAGVPVEGEKIDGIDNTFSSDEIVSEAAEFKEILEGRLNNLDKCIQDISEKINTLSRGNADASDEKDASVRAYYGYFKQLGFSSEMSANLFSGYIKRIKNTEDLVDKASGWISRLLETTSEELVERGGVVALVGPTGAGKTTSILKIAGRFLQKNRTSEIGIITTDVESVYLKSKLNHYCDVYDVDFEYVSSAKELNDALVKMKDKKLVLVDTHGVSQRNKFSLTSLKSMLNKFHKEIEVYLVLPASLQEAVMKEVVERFTFKRLSGCILTKQDECISMVPALSVAMLNELKIMYVCNGQDLELDIEFPTKKYLMNFFPAMFNDNLMEVDYRAEPYTLKSLLGAVGARFY